MSYINKLLVLFFTLTIITALPTAHSVEKTAEKKPVTVSNPVVRLTTTMGVINLELDQQKAPVTVKNFLRYVNSGFYDGTVFHRVIKDFMIQGGGFKPGLQKKNPKGPIKNEADNGLKNKAGTVAMARTNDPHSASSQFFINTIDNGFLDFKRKPPGGWGYAVFGKVTEGMEVVKKIEASATRRQGARANVPVHDVVIFKAERLNRPAKK
jgi:cyclophilin family peptidyl-prolyl cis-trans isomerase